MPTKRTGRPSVVAPGASQNIYLPSKHIVYVEKLARRDYLSFSAAVRLIIERDFKVHGGEVLS